MPTLGEKMFSGSDPPMFQASPWPLSKMASGCLGEGGHLGHHGGEGNRLSLTGCGWPCWHRHVRFFPCSPSDDLGLCGISLAFASPESAFLAAPAVVGLMASSVPNPPLWGLLDPPGIVKCQGAVKQVDVKASSAQPFCTFWFILTWLEVGSETFEVPKGDRGAFDVPSLNRSSRV